jgi:hypothetical protein
MDRLSPPKSTPHFPRVRRCIGWSSTSMTTLRRRRAHSATPQVRFTTHQCSHPGAPP